MIAPDLASYTERLQGRAFREERAARVRGDAEQWPRQAYIPLSDEALPYRRTRSAPCAHWVAGGRGSRSGHSLAECTMWHGQFFDHVRAMTTPVGPVVLNQPYLTNDEHVPLAEGFAARWRLQVVPVGETPSTSAVLFGRLESDLSLIVDRLQVAWKLLVMR